MGLNRSGHSGGEERYPCFFRESNLGRQVHSLLNPWIEIRNGDLQNTREMSYPPHSDVQGGKQQPEREKQGREKDPILNKVLKMNQNQRAVTLSLACIVSTSLAAYALARNN
jgi:hypothetical protein